MFSSYRKGQVEFLFAFNNKKTPVALHQEDLFYCPYVYMSGEFPCEEFNKQQCAFLNKFISESTKKLGPSAKVVSHEEFKRLLEALDYLDKAKQELTLKTDKCMLCLGEEFCYCGTVPTQRFNYTLNEEIQNAEDLESLFENISDEELDDPDSFEEA